MGRSNKQGSKGRSPNCSKCSELKEPSYLTSGYCRKCKLESIATRRAKARLERGQLPFGEGRHPSCYECGKVKENPKHGYCNECHSAKGRQQRVKNGQDPEFCIKERAKNNAKFNGSILLKIRRNIHILTNVATRLGIIDRQPCEVCGNMKVDAHHDDYNKPLEVRWLCRAHHNEHHRINGAANEPLELLQNLIERNLI